MMRVAPLASVKSVTAHMLLAVTALCGFGTGITWSSAWIGWADSPGWIVMLDRLLTRQPGSSMWCISASTTGWTGTCAYRSPNASRL